MGVGWAGFILPSLPGGLRDWAPGAGVTMCVGARPLAEPEAGYQPLCDSSAGWGRDVFVPQL